MHKDTKVQRKMSELSNRTTHEPPKRRLISTTETEAESNTSSVPNANANSKASIFIDFSKKFLNRVNSGNQSYYTNLKRGFKANRLRKNSKATSNANDSHDKDLAPVNCSDQSTSSLSHLFERTSQDTDSLKNHTTLLLNGQTTTIGVNTGRGFGKGLTHRDGKHLLNHDLI